MDFSVLIIILFFTSIATLIFALSVEDSSKVRSMKVN